MNVIMEENGLIQTNFFLKLHKCRYWKENDCGTISDFMKELGSKNNYTSFFINELIKKKVLVQKHFEKIKGNLVPVYTIDPKKFVLEFSKNDVFKKIYLIIWHESGVWMGEPEFYSEEERKEMGLK